MDDSNSNQSHNVRQLDEEKRPAKSSNPLLDSELDQIKENIWSFSDRLAQRYLKVDTVNGHLKNHRSCTFITQTACKRKDKKDNKDKREGE